MHMQMRKRARARAPVRCRERRAPTRRLGRWRRCVAASQTTHGGRGPLASPPRPPLASEGPPRVSSRRGWPSSGTARTRRARPRPRLVRVRVRVRVRARARVRVRVRVRVRLGLGLGLRLHHEKDFSMQATALSSGCAVTMMSPCCSASARTALALRMVQPTTYRCAMFGGSKRRNASRSLQRRAGE